MLLKQATPDQTMDSLFTYILNLRIVSGRRNPKSYLSTFPTDKNRLQLKPIYICIDAFKHNDRIIKIINLIAKIKETTKQNHNLITNDFKKNIFHQPNARPPSKHVVENLYLVKLRTLIYNTNLTYV